jgi:hypothetical protein
VRRSAGAAAHADVAGVTKFRAKDDWRRYMTAVVGVLENGG